MTMIPEHQTLGRVPRLLGVPALLALHAAQAAAGTSVLFIEIGRASWRERV